MGEREPERVEVVEDDLRLVNVQGLHARPAQLVVKTASAFTARVTLSREGVEVDAKSIMGVMMLAAEKGTVLRVRAEGADAAQAIASLKELFASGFGEEI